jgi:TPR repeat/BRCA1 C Terminus (BRCT) domain/Tetratricopeptide repeat
LVSPSPDRRDRTPLEGQLVVFTGKLTSLGRRDARALVERCGGSTADDVNARTTMLVVGDEGFGPLPADDAGQATRDTSQKLRRAETLNARGASIAIVAESDFCRMVGVTAPDTLRRQFHSVKELLARYRGLREDHLRYLVKCGIIRPAVRTHADAFLAFPELAVIKQANDELDAGASFQAVVRALLASRHGQLTLDFRLDASPAKIIELRARTPDGPAAPLDHRVIPAREMAIAEDYFRAASALDDGDPAKLDDAAAAYRRALEHDPYLAAALINLANIHYSHDELAEAQALYERAIALESDFFEAHFNLGNIYHDLGRFSEAQTCYIEALRLNPRYADAHFYLAVTLEKIGLSSDARPHWQAYRQLAPQGEWAELAKEFSE